MARKYEMKRRAERQQQTHQRIVDATVELHRTIGPLRTTISAIAEKAGVQRHTYYAHFPELRDLYRACSGHYVVEHPPPEHSAWAKVADHEERLRRALSEVYAYYGHHEQIFANVLRDAEVDTLCAEFTDPVFENWKRTWSNAVAEGWDTEGERGEALMAAIGLALDFQTWRTLVRQQGLGEDRAVELMVGMVRCLMST
jgi:AcrR family transcriptional regulator